MKHPNNEQFRTQQFSEYIQGVNAIVAAYKVGDPKIHELLRTHGIITENTPVTEVADILRNDKIDAEIIAALKPVAEASLAPLSEIQRIEAMSRSINPYFR